MCLNSRCFNISFHELILSAQSSRRLILVEFLSAVIMLDEDPESKDVKIKMTQLINILGKGIWIEKTAIVL